MKYLIALFLLFGSAAAKPNIPIEISPRQYGIDDGWYVASVKYFNYGTYTQGRYTLKVRVQNNRVTAIDFGNGGSVHTGFNNGNYFYSGGYLDYDKDSYGNIIAAFTKVTITDNSIRTFEITIQ